MFLAKGHGSRCRKLRTRSLKSWQKSSLIWPCKVKLLLLSRNSYSGAFCRWKKWAATKREIGSSLPPKPIHIALYLAFLTQRSKTSAPLMEAVCALSWVNNMATVEDTTSHPLVQQILSGAKRKLAHKTVKKEPITPEILSALVDKFGKEQASLSDIRTLSMCLVGYAGFFRFDELAKLKEADVSFYEEHMEIFVESSKTDQLREGAWVVIARTKNKLHRCQPHNMRKCDSLLKKAGFCIKNRDNTVRRSRMIKT